ncbi:putative transcription factor interactor and regulator CCHC(Zn) family [Helianthus annuus]|nr:putative transcription factor interactor and regulator CCHC(Zn) family [Helianthus annuus]
MLVSRQFRYYPELSIKLLLLILSFTLCFCIHYSYTMQTNSNVNQSSATMHSNFQQSGIKATVKKDGIMQSTSTILPCEHCTDEKIEKQRKESHIKLCYYCHEPGHRIISCKVKENNEATQLIQQAINTGIRRQNAEDDFTMELIVTGTEGGLCGDIWYVSTVFKHHYAGNLNVFKRIKHMVGVETKTGEDNFLFIRGVGVVEVKSGNESLRIQSVFYTPELDRNVLSLDQLVLQGYTVKMNGEKCKIYSMFSALVSNTKNEITGLTKEDELGMKEKQKVISHSSVNEEYKANYLNSYFENLHLSSLKPDWNVMILQAMEFHDFTNCKSLLDMLEVGEFVFKYKHELEVKFEEMLEWFIKIKLGISTRPIPPYSADNRKIDLLDLYMVVKRDGGYKNVTANNLWAVVAKDMGYDYNDGELMRIIFAMYLDVLVYYYKFKTIQENVKEKEMIRSDEGPSTNSRERSKSEGNAQEEETIQHYALFAGNDWHGMKKMQKRRRFDFKQAAKAVDEANQSVLQISTKT